MFVRNSAPLVELTAPLPKGHHFPRQLHKGAVVGAEGAIQTYGSLGSLKSHIKNGPPRWARLTTPIPLLLGN